MTALVTRLDALHALAVAPFAVAVLVLIVGATWLAIQDEAKRDRQSLMSPETEADYYTRWDLATPITVRAATQQQAINDAAAALGQPRRGRYWVARVKKVVAAEVSR